MKNNNRLKMNVELFKNQFNNVALSNYLILEINNKDVGYVNCKVSNLLLLHHKDLFIKTDDKLILKIKEISFDDCSNLFRTILDTCVSNNIISEPRNEDILVKDFTLLNNIMKVDRGIGHLFGFVGQGIHVNLFVKKGEKYFLWISKRGNTKVEPFKFDSAIAGAIPYKLTATQTVIKEGKEEANLSYDITNKSKFVTSLSYKIEKYGGLRNDIMHIFDLQISEDIKPYPFDNEAEDFYLLNSEELQSHLVSNLENYKYNSVLSILYFLYDHKLINNSILSLKNIKDILKHVENIYSNVIVE